MALVGQRRALLICAPERVEQRAALPAVATYTGQAAELARDPGAVELAVVVERQARRVVRRGLCDLERAADRVVLGVARVDHHARCVEPLPVHRQAGHGVVGVGDRADACPRDLCRTSESVEADGMCTIRGVEVNQATERVVGVAMRDPVLVGLADQVARRVDRRLRGEAARLMDPGDELRRAEGQLAGHRADHTGLLGRRDLDRVAESGCDGLDQRRAQRTESVAGQRRDGLVGHCSDERAPLGQGGAERDRRRAEREVVTEPAAASQRLAVRGDEIHRAP